MKKGMELTMNYPVQVVAADGSKKIVLRQKKRARNAGAEVGVWRMEVAGNLDEMRVTSKAVPPYWYTCHMSPRRLRIFIPTMYLPLRYILPPYG